MLRTFIAITLPAVIGDKLAEVQGRLKQAGDRVRWVRPENIHLTLKFLGSVEESLSADILEVMRKSVADIAHWKAEVKGVGSFPGATRPRIIWVGVNDEDSRLAQIHKNLDRGLRKLGIKGESRIFHPHLTLGRVKRGSAELTRTISSLKEFEAGKFEVEDIILFQSQLTPNGAIHTPLGKAVLGI